MPAQHEKADLDPGMESEIRRPGAVVTEGGVLYRVWAPAHPRAEVWLYGEGGARARTVALLRNEDGCLQGMDPQGRAGDLYKIHLPGRGEFPDPASRAQAAGVHGPSRVVDARSFAWTDAVWQRP